MFLTLSGSGMDLRHVDRVTTPDIPYTAGPVGPPVKFATWQDPLSRFELGYPLAWRLEAEDGVTVRSNRLASFARVDVFPRPESSWAEFQAALAGRGALLTIRKEIPESRRILGTLEIEGKRFDYQARAFTRGSETIVLSTGCDAVAGPLKHYEVQVLRAIQRVFKIL